MPALPKSHRKQLLTTALKDLPLTNKLKKHLSKNSDITPAMVNNLKQVITSLNGSNDTHAQLDDFAEKYIRDSFKALSLNYIGRKKKKEPKEERFYEPEYTNCNYSLNVLTDKLSEHSTGRLCLYGPPGTGKTEYAHYLAKQLDKKLLVTGPSDFLNKFVGGTERNIAKTFKEAKEQKAILLIDEVDTLLSNRNGATRNWEVSQVNEMLTQIQNFTGILIATTNRLDALDPAIFRRFHFKIGFEFMTFEQSQKLLKHHLKALAVKGRMTKKLNEKLQYCGNLTPGDFSVVSDRLKFLECESIEQYILELMEETKHRRAQNKSIGFSATV
jgi:SpoVK/Ycf46/Vps4 family AAA+-type ATPase